MDAFDLLLGIAQVGAAFVGFSSIVAIFGRSDGAWDQSDRIRFRNLVELALLVAILGFLPLAVFTLHPVTADTWAVSSAVLGCIVAIDLLLWVRRARILHGIGSLRVWMAGVGIASLGCALVLQIFNLSGWMFHQQPGPYVGGLFLLLFLAGLQFALLVFGRLES